MTSWIRGERKIYHIFEQMITTTKTITKETERIPIFTDPIEVKIQYVINSYLEYSYNTYDNTYHYKYKGKY